MENKIDWEVMEDTLKDIFTHEFIQTLKMIYADEDSILRLARKRRNAIEEINNYLKEIEEKENKENGN